MTAKKIQPKNPETQAEKTDSKSATDRKTSWIRVGGRKSARKTSGFSFKG